MRTIQRLLSRLGKNYCQFVPPQTPQPGGDGGGSFSGGTSLPPPSGGAPAGGGFGGGGTQTSTAALAGGGGVGTYDVPILVSAPGAAGVAQGPAVAIGPREIVEVWPSVTGTNAAFVGLNHPNAATAGPRFRMAISTPSRVLSITNLAQIFVVADAAGEGIFISRRTR